LSRHRFVQRKRSKLAIVAAAGAFTVASAATATAMTWPSGGAAAGTASLTAFTQAQATIATRQYRSELTLREEATAAAAAAQAAAKQKAAKLAAAQAASKRAVAAQAQAAAAQARAAAAQARAAAAQARAATAQVAAQKRAQAALATAETSGTPQQIAAAMLSQYGWSSDQMSCLQPLWQRESNWQVTATNASSGAFGIPQALPASKMASAGSDWQTSAYTQIKWGLGYIQQVYGSPCGAWNHEMASGWY
jgi:hypothetical protein